MKAALGWIMATRWRAIAVITAFAILPLAGILAAGMIALTVLRHGLREGLLVTVAAAGILLVLDLTVGSGNGRLVLLGAVNWLPVVGLAAVLARTVSLSRTLQLAGLLGVGMVVGVFAVAGDPASMWQEVLRDQVLPFLDRSGVRYNREGVEEALPAMSALMTGMAAAFWAIGHFISVLIGRWWQAILIHPGGFREEFHALRLGGTATVVGSVVFILAVLVDTPLLANLGLVVVMVFAMQGMAILHGVAGRAKLHWAWLVPPYVFLVMLPPHMLALLAVMGFIDHWIDFRGRIKTTMKGE